MDLKKALLSVGEQLTNRKYRPEIDGLRAVAVIAVMLFHAGVGFPGGYVGVDVFFVISGFLITGIILRALDKNEFSLANFWERRIRRIFPALAVVVAFTLAGGYCILIPSDLRELGESAVSQAFMLANAHFWRDTGYFAGPAESKPLLHTWSLAVEEQFYLFFPVLLIALKRRSRSALFWIIGGLSAVSLAASVYGTRFHPNAAFFLLPTRAWELFAGCLLASAPWQIVSKPLRDEVMSLAGLGCILVSMLFFNSQTPFPGIAALLPVGGTVAVLYATTATRSTYVGRLLSFRALVFVGLISYSMYLWHWPILVYVRYVSESMGSQEAIASLILAFLAAVMSWRVVELPIRSRRLIEGRQTVYIAAASATAVLLAVSGWFIKSDGVLRRFDFDVALLAEDVTWIGTEYEIGKDESFSSQNLPSLGAAMCSTRRPDFMLWGDSHGMVLSPLIDDVASKLKLAGVAAVTRGLPPLPNLWKPEKASVRDVTLARSAAVMNYLKRTRPRNLLLVGRWSGYCEGKSKIEMASDPEASGQESMVADRHGSEPSPATASRSLSRQLHNLVSYCEPLGITVWILKQVPETGEATTARDFLSWSLGRRNHPPSRTCSIADHRERQRLPDKIFQEVTAEHVRIIDPATFCFGPDGQTENYKDGRARYRDDDHLTRWGAESLRTVLTQALMQMQELKGGAARRSPRLMNEFDLST